MLQTHERAEKWAPAFAGVERPSLAMTPGLHILPVVRRLAGDRDVVDVALAQAGRGDADEAAVALHLSDGAAAGIAHRGAQTADQLVDDVADRALVRDAALDALWDELQRARHLLLEIAVRRAARHGADRAHAAIGFIG